MSGKFDQKRMDGYLSRLSRITRIKRAIFFDTETHIVHNPDKSIDFPFRLGYAIYCEYDATGAITKQEELPFYERTEFIKFIVSHLTKRTRLYVFAHNIGFDLRVIGLRDLLKELDGKSEPPIINQKIFIFDVRTESGLVTFLDTANYGVTTVKSLGQDMGYPKLSVDFDTVGDDELMTYCHRDTQIIAEFVYTLQKFLIDNGLGPTKHTLASQALATFRYKFMYHAPYMHTNEQALRLEQEGYKGGRTECFHIGALPPGMYYYVDVNSIYPYAMKLDTLPIKLLGYSESVSIKHLKVRVKTRYVIADVLLKTEDNAYPYTDGGKLLFPVGTYRTVLHSPELELALENDQVVHCYRCAVYQQGAIFDRYVDFFYGLKQEYTTQGNTSFRYIAKLFLNSLYGKFGQDKVIREKIGITAKSKIFRVPAINMDTKERYAEICWLGVIIRETRGGETPHTFKGLAGAVTSHARRLLWDYIEIAGRANVFYTDTDSLIVNQQGYDNLAEYLDPLTLGYFKLEKQDTQVEIFGPKDYTFGDIVHHKGIPTSSIINERGKWEYVQFEGLMSFINSGALGFAKGHIAEKTRKTPYTKGIVDDETGRVRPIRLP